MWQQRRALITKIEEHRKSRLLCCVMSDRPNAVALIGRDAVQPFFNLLREFGKLERLDVFIFTAGGDTLAAFALARLVREFAKWIGVLIPEKCHSAGTLFALGANKVFMTRAATLSPIDPSIMTPLNPVNPLIDEPPRSQRQVVAVSVESVAGFKALLDEDWKIKDEQNLTAAFKMLAERVHPLVLGDIFRRRQQIELLARRLLEQHRDDEAQVKRIITVLTRELGSHDYPISRTEAKELICDQIESDDPELEGLVWDLHQDYSEDLRLGVPYDPAMMFNQMRSQADKAGKVRIRQNLAVIESGSSRYVYEHELLLSETQVPGPVGSAKAIQLEPTDAGWKRYTA